MKIVIHTCCADCFLNTLNYLSANKNYKKNLEIVSFFFNPNIHPRSEYMERLNALKKIISQQNYVDNIKLVIPEYRPKEYFEIIKKENNGFNNSNNNSCSKIQYRCLKCWTLRIRKLFEYSSEIGADAVTTTLLTSHYQNHEEILNIAKNISKEFNIDFIHIDSSCNCKHTGFYKQNFCGCCFSLTEKLLKKYEHF